MAFFLEILSAIHNMILILNLIYSLIVFQIKFINNYLIYYIFLYRKKEIIKILRLLNICMQKFLMKFLEYVN